jgi:DNA repair protein RecN (Recombination protein N)
VLQELRVENLLLIESAQLRLAPGLNVLTGETGAGKTVLAHALDLLLGGRAKPSIVRPGTGEAYVEGVFDLNDALGEELRERLPADATEVVLARRVGTDGRTRAYLNGRAATVADLRDIGARLFAFYGQHEHRKLTLAAAQLQILDELCGAGQASRLSACAAAFAETGTLAGRLEALSELASARERELELLEHELAEIDAAALREDEHEELLALRERLRRLDALRSAAGAGAEALAPDSSEQPGTAALLAGAVSGLDALTGLDPRLDGLAERMRGLLIESQELAVELRDYGAGAGGEDLDTALAGLADSGDPGGGLSSLDLLEERLALIERLTRKHGGSLRAVLDYACAARARRDELTGAEVAHAQTTDQLREARAELERRVLALRSEREAAAPRLALAVRGQLGSLAMGDATFEVLLGEREPGPSGADTVEFLIAPNPGVPAGPLREIASGGELSRVMLALAIASERAACSEEGEAQGAGPGGGGVAGVTLVFDEVDAGIGGQTAKAVGERLRELGEGRQVLCITHLPQIASLGDRHFSIVKDTSVQPTRTSVVQLGEGEVVSELVRMLGADTDDTVARRHARELRRAA